MNEVIRTAADIAPSVIPPQGNPKNKTILVAESEAAVQKVLSQTLSNEGYHTVEAPDGKEALNIARSVHLDLVIADLRLGEMDGLNLVSAAKSTVSTLRITC